MPTQGANHCRTEAVAIPVAAGEQVRLPSVLIMPIAAAGSMGRTASADSCCVIYA